MYTAESLFNLTTLPKNGSFSVKDSGLGQTSFNCSSTVLQHLFNEDTSPLDVNIKRKLSIFSKTSRVVLSNLNELGQQKTQGYFLVPKPSLCKHLFSHQSFNCRFGNRTSTLTISWFYYSNFQIIKFNFWVKKKKRERENFGALQLILPMDLNVLKWKAVNCTHSAIHANSMNNSCSCLISISSRNDLFKWKICAKHEFEMLCRNTSLEELWDHSLLCSIPQYVIPTFCWCWCNQGFTDLMQWDPVETSAVNRHWNGKT